MVCKFSDSLELSPRTPKIVYENFRALRVARSRGVALGVKTRNALGLLSLAVSPLCVTSRHLPFFSQTENLAEKSLSDFQIL